MHIRVPLGFQNTNAKCPNANIKAADPSQNYTVLSW